MNYAEMGYTALGGLGIFFLGLTFLTDSLQMIAGDFIRRMIRAVTSNRIIALFIGLVVTAIVQSSSITTVMIIGFVNAGLMELRQAVGVILGANIGTTITGWILAIKVGKYGLLFIGPGALLMLFGRKDKIKAFGKVITAVGFLFFGLQLMSDAFKPLRCDQDFLGYLSLFDASSIPSLLGCVLVGCLLTFVIQSSSAMLGITIALASTGALTYPTAAALVLGENIGTTITALLAGINSNTNARRAAVSHALFNIIGVSIIVLIFDQFTNIVDYLVPGDPEFLTPDGEKPLIAAHIAMGHTLFNVSASIVMLPCLTLFVRFVEFLVPAPASKEQYHLRYPGHGVHISPSVALDLAAAERKKLARLVRELLEATKAHLASNKYNEELFQRVTKRETISDNIQKEMTEYIRKVMESSLTAEESTEAQSLMRGTHELEAIADYAHAICRYRNRLHRHESSFSEEVWTDILKYFDEILLYYNEIAEMVFCETLTPGNQIAATGKTLGEHGDAIRELHLKRLEQNKTPPLDALTFSDIIVSLRRIKNHCLNLYETLEH